MNKVTSFIYMIFFMLSGSAWSDTNSDTNTGATTPYIVVFGDSLSDGAIFGNRKGNNSWLQTAGRSEQMGRGAPVTNWPYDNPTTWVNNMGEEFFPGESAMGLLFQCSEKRCDFPILNAAFASAQTGDNYINDKSDKPYMPVESRCTHYGDYGQYSCVPGVLKQIELVSSVGINWKKVGVILWAGNNDIFQNIAKLKTIYGEKLDKGNVVSGKLKQLKAANNHLTESSYLTESSFDQFFKDMAGNEYNKLNFSNPIINTRKAMDILEKDKQVPVNHIVVIGLSDLGKIPASSGLKTISSLLSLFSKGYNDTLKNSTLRGDIEKGLIFVDLSKWQNQQIKNPMWVQDAPKRTCLSDKQQELCVVPPAEHTPANGKWLCDDCFVIGPGKWLCDDCFCDTAYAAYLC